MKFYENNCIKKIISGATGLVLAFSSIAAVKADTSNQQEGSIKINLVQQDRKTAEMNLEEYTEIVTKVYNELLNKNINYDGIQQDIQCAVALANIEYIYGKELEQQLVSNGFILPFDLTLIGNEGQNNYSPVTEGWFNVNAADRLIDEINDYNHRKLGVKKEAIIDNGIDEMFDISVFFKNKHDKNASTTVFENIQKFARTLATSEDIKEDSEEATYYKKTGAITDSAQVAHEALTSLNAGTTKNNNSNLSVGAGWLNARINGTTNMHFIAQYLLAKYSKKVLSTTGFNKQMLNEGTLYIDNSEIVDTNSIDDSMLAYFVGTFAEEQRFVYDTPTNELFNLLGMRCITPEEANSIYGGKSK